MATQPADTTSDIGQMYRQLLQSRGVPLTAANMSRVIDESRRNPGLIAGLTVQGYDPSQNATPPPNVAGASPSSSGQSPAVPTTAPLPTPPAYQPPPQQQGGAATPPPGSAGAATPGNNDNGLPSLASQLAQVVLGGGAGALPGILGARGAGIGNGFGINPQANAVAPTGADVPATSPVPGSPAAPGGGPDVPMIDPATGMPSITSEPVTATSPIGNILTDQTRAIPLPDQSGVIPLKDESVIPMPDNSPYRRPPFAEAAGQQVPAQRTPAEGTADQPGVASGGPGVGQGGSAAKQIEGSVREPVGSARNYPGARGFGRGARVRVP